MDNALAINIVFVTDFVRQLMEERREIFCPLCQAPIILRIAEDFTEWENINVTQWEDMPEDYESTLWKFIDNYKL